MRAVKGVDIMIRKVSQLALVVLVAIGLFGASFVAKAEAKSKKKVGFFTKMSRKIKRKVKHIAKKTRRSVCKTAAKIEDKIADAGVAAKKKITGKKKKTHVMGHYKKGQKSMTNGHMRKTRKHKKSSGGGGGYAPAPAPAPADPSMPVDPAFPQ